MNNDILQRIRVRLLGISTIVVCVLIATIVIWNCIYKIPAGYCGLRYDIDGGISDTVYDQGWTMILPTSKMYLYPSSTEVFSLSQSGDEDTSIQISTADGKVVKADVIISLHVQREQLPAVFTKFRGQTIEQIENGYIKSELLRCTNEVSSRYNLMNLIGDQRSAVNQEIFNKLRDSLEPCGIIIETTSISGVVPDEQTAEAIAKVVAAQNRLEQAKIDRQTAEIEAERAVTEAEGKRRANELLQQSLTPEILIDRAISKWNGSTPQVMASDILGTLNLKDFLSK